MKKNKNQSTIDPTETSTTYSAPEFSIPETSKMYSTMDDNENQEVLGIDERQTISVKQIKQIKQMIEDASTKFGQQEQIQKCKIERNSCGLLKNLNYEFDEIGFVNYKKLIPREFLVPNKQFFQNRKIAVPDSIENLSDKEMIVLLTGYKTLAAIRGFRSVDHQIVSASHESVTVQTKISWIGNYETDFRSVDYTALATASLSNTYSFCKNYLAEIAQNRGEVRAIRGFLRIPILGSDELGPQNEDDNVNAKNESNSNPVSPHSVLQKKMTEKNISFDKIKSTSLSKKNSDGSCKFPDAEKWESVLNIPVAIVLEILNNLAAKEKKND